LVADQQRSCSEALLEVKLSSIVQVALPAPSTRWPT
jgi:hypothetical protein